MSRKRESKPRFTLYPGVEIWRNVKELCRRRGINIGSLLLNIIEDVLNNNSEEEIMKRYGYNREVTRDVKGRIASVDTEEYREYLRKERERKEKENKIREVVGEKLLVWRTEKGQHVVKEVLIEDVTRDGKMYTIRFRDGKTDRWEVDTALERVVDSLGLPRNKTGMKRFLQRYKTSIEKFPYIKDADRRDIKGDFNPYSEKVNRDFEVIRDNFKKCGLTEKEFKRYVSIMRTVQKRGW
ncbi:hypothetical protein GLW05_20930 [Pontibacillus yanchengensis]|uniref:Uncharacterized protein n=1 Tax=Pontibacillus yanchengensis TaxID=462910 RepID=A0A6I5A796_9BACI|nr:hypothetical protein [Pontibacillus yanchengensis]MYL36039.1 hypothetical protein [Pontibacillus yanchengensis]